MARNEVKRPRRPEKPETHLSPWLAPTGFILGILGIASMVRLAVAIPEPTEAQFNVIRTVIALGGAACTMTLTGFLSIKVPLPAKGSIVGGGTLAVFLVLYFFNPATHLVRTSTQEYAGKTAAPLAAHLP